MSSHERSRLQVDERRAQLLALGLELFGSRSYDEISIDEIARAAGISKGLLYHYFPSKREFYVEVVRHTAEELLAHTDIRPETPSVEALRQGLDAYLDYVEAHAGAYTTFLRSGIGFDRQVAELADQTRARFVERMIENMRLEPTSALRIALRGWTGFVEATSLQWLDEREPSRETLRELMVQALVAIIAAAGLPPQPG